MAPASLVCAAKRERTIIDTPAGLKPHGCSLHHGSHPRAERLSGAGAAGQPLWHHVAGERGVLGEGGAPVLEPLGLWLEAGGALALALALAPPPPGAALLQGAGVEGAAALPEDALHVPLLVRCRWVVVLDCLAHGPHAEGECSRVGHAA